MVVSTVHFTKSSGSTTLTLPIFRVPTSMPRVCEASKIRLLEIDETFSNFKEVFTHFFHNTVTLASTTTQQIQQTPNFIAYVTTSIGNETMKSET